MTLDALLRALIREALQEELRGFSQARLSSANDNAHATDAPMTTTEAARYCGFKSTAAIRKAVRDGRLVPLGRRGGTGTYMWSRHALDAFLAGARGAIVPLGRPGAPLGRIGGTHGTRNGSGDGTRGSRQGPSSRAYSAGRRGAFSSGENRPIPEREGECEIRMNRAAHRRVGGVPRASTGDRERGEGSRPQKTTRIRFSDYVVSLFERKMTEAEDQVDEIERESGST